MKPDSRILRVIGLMSGTSADGVDAAALETDGAHHIKFLDALTLPYAVEFQERLIGLAHGDVPLLDVLRIERELTEYHIHAVTRLRARAALRGWTLDLIGFHGHTIRHRPDEGLTWQLGDASLLAEHTSTPVVADFRRRDLALGGQGAPLAPLYHAALLHQHPKPVAVLNLGGVGNLTWCGAKGEIIAGDTGPGCGLLDAWAVRHLQSPFDRDGQLAARGTVDRARVVEFLRHPFFGRPFPKSADRFDFNSGDLAHLAAEDGAATLCAMTAEAVRIAFGQFPEAPRAIYVTGGGVHHPVLMQEIRQRLGTVESVAALGLRPGSLEAECFAWLAVRHLHGLPFALPTTTGCAEPRTGGGLY
ncbi:MAG TPA: anhydro-N-acetylmuramic acid kinase [Pirellulaceae bacterium]